MGVITTDGYLKITDRLKDVIKSGGEWISSIDLENALAGHPAVRRAAVVGLRTPVAGAPVALVVPEPGHDIDFDQLRTHLAATFAKWQLPDEILVVDDLPMTSVGKLDKKTLREEYADFYSGR